MPEQTPAQPAFRRCAWCGYWLHVRDMERINTNPKVLACMDVLACDARQGLTASDRATWAGKVRAEVAAMVEARGMTTEVSTAAVDVFAIRAARDPRSAAAAGVRHQANLAGDTAKEVNI